jgi:hypothetical protein
MPGKPQKTEAELRALLMAEIRRRRNCATVVNVGIERPAQLAPHHPYWRPVWVVDGAPAVPWEAEQIGRNLQTQFDLKR